MSKKAKVALVNPPTLKECSPPTLRAHWLAYLAAVLEKAGHEITVIDCPALGMSEDDLNENSRDSNQNS